MGCFHHWKFEDDRRHGYGENVQTDQLLVTFGLFDCSDLEIHDGCLLLKRILSPATNCTMLKVDRPNTWGKIVRKQSDDLFDLKI